MRQPVRSVHVRLPKTLHEKLMARAADEGVSLSLLVATLLAAAHPYDFRDDDEPEPGESSREDDEPSEDDKP